MKNLRKIMGLVCLIMVMLLCSACAAKNEVTATKEGKGTYSTIVSLDDESLTMCGCESVQDIKVMLDESKVEGVNLKTEVVKDEGKDSIKVSFVYNSQKEFTEIINKLNQVVQGVNEEDFVLDEEMLAQKGVNVYLEETTVNTAVIEYLNSNGITVDASSNEFRKFMKLFKSKIEVHLEEEMDEAFIEGELDSAMGDVFDEMFGDISEEDLDNMDWESLNSDEEYFDEEYYEDEEYFDEEYEYDVEEDGYLVITNNKEISEMRLHIDAIDALSGYVYSVMSANANMDLLMSGGMGYDEDRKNLYVEAFGKTTLAQKIKESFVTVEGQETNYVLESMTPAQMIDIFNDEFVDELNAAIDESFVDTLMEDEEFYEEQELTQYTFTFEDKTLTVDEEEIFEHIGDDGYILLSTNNKAAAASAHKDEFDDTPKTGDVFSYLMFGSIALFAIVGAVFFYTKRRQVI